MRVVLAAPCLKRYDLLQKLIESAERGSRKPDNYYVIDNGGLAAGKMQRGELVLPSSAQVIFTGKGTHGRGNGVAASWNMALAANRDAHVIISNDDVQLHHGTVEALIRAAEDPAHASAEFIYPSFNPGAMFCVFLIKHSLTDKIGGFDEGFYPAYFEDNDYHRRMKLASVVEYQADGASYDHVVSATMKSLSGIEMRQHHADFENNKRRYIQKWGNMPGLEAYDKPKC